MNIRKNALCTFVCLSIFACAACGNEQKPAATPPTVIYRELQAENVDLKREMPGRVVARRMAEVRPQVGGILKARLFEEGDEIKQGQILYKIDDAPLKAAHDEAKANLARSRSRLDAARRHMERCILLTKNNKDYEYLYTTGKLGFAASAANLYVVCRRNDNGSCVVCISANIFCAGRGSGRILRNGAFAAHGISGKDGKSLV